VRPQLGPISRHRIAAQAAGPSSTTGRLLVNTEPRSRRYLDTVQRLDATGTATAADLERVIDDIRREFADRWAALPLGLVSRCYLGAPFEVHTLAPDDGILEHYKIGQSLPGPLEAARKHSLSGLYLLVEVYSNRLVCTVTLGGADA
jgi:hypothetical protein